jgi:capsular exopolysaccharide synthesis family protein
MVQEQFDSLPDNSGLYERLSAKIQEEAASLSLKQKEYAQLYESYKNEPEPWYVELAQEASLPSAPIGRSRENEYILGIVGAFFLSIFAGIIFEAIDKRIYTKGEVEKELKLPVIAEANKIFLVRGRKKSPIDYRDTSPLFKKCEQIHTFLKVDIFKGDLNKKAVLITSAEKNTGKTSIACSLALAAARNGEKVLLIDANLRFPSIDKVFRFEDEAKGLSDILRGSITHKDAVRNLTDLLLSGSLKLKEKELRGLDNLKILLSGARVENPLGLLGTKEFSDLLNELKETYGFLIIDTAAIKGYPDTVNIMPSADALLLVARKARTTYPLLKDAIEQGNKINAPLTGLILSHV